MNPATTTLRSFSSLDDASGALQALADSGVPKGSMELVVLQDEAGPVEGNFLIGNGATTHGDEPAAVRTGNEVPYDENFRAPTHRGGFLLVLSGLDEAQLAAADPLFARFGGVQVEDVASRAGAS
ncbi:MAG TPA: hypothetical protein VNB23_14095 [Ramlibacter sp.]|nr:hypothetical protein [Ramlibacter sp.]